MKNLRLIIHGDNIQASRFLLTQTILDFKASELIFLSGPQLTQTNLVQACESNSMFFISRLVVIEQVFSGPKSNEKKQIIDKLSQYQSDFPINLIIWENKALTKTMLKPFINWDNKSFAISKSLFQFLDSVQPNSKLLFSLFESCKKTEPIQLLFYMFHRRISSLIHAYYKTGSFFKSSPWQQSKLLGQAGKFTIEKLVDIYKYLLQIEINQKTGKSPVCLETEFSLFLAKL